MLLNQSKICSYLGNLFFETDVVNEEVTLYAGWKANRYVVSFQTNVNHGNLLDQPSQPTREGYDFQGWLWIENVQ